VQCTGVVEFVDCVTMARERDLLLSVRGGGHNIAGTCIADDALMLDLSQMRGVCTSTFADDDWTASGVCRVVSPAGRQ